MDLYHPPKKKKNRLQNKSCWLTVHRIRYLQVETDYFQDKNLMNTKELKKTKWQCTRIFGTFYCIIFFKKLFLKFGSL